MTTYIIRVAYKSNHFMIKINSSFIENLQVSRVFTEKFSHLSFITDEKNALAIFKKNIANQNEPKGKVEFMPL